MDTNQKVGQVFVPTFIVAGAGRSGTTALMQALGWHKDVFVTNPKEPNYLAFGDSYEPFAGPGDDVTINIDTVKSEHDYAALFKGAQAKQSGEGSVSSLYYASDAADRLHSRNPDARIIILLREPISRASSAFHYMKARGFESMPDLASALAAEKQRMDENWHHLWHYKHMSLYAEGVQTYQNRFGLDQVGIWFFEDLQTRRREVLSEVFSFLDLNNELWTDRSTGPVNVSGTPRLAALQYLIRQAGSRPLIRNSIKSVVPFGAREYIRSKNLKSPGSTLESVPSEIRSEFADDKDQLETILRLPVPW